MMGQHCQHLAAVAVREELLQASLHFRGKHFFRSLAAAQQPFENVLRLLPILAHCEQRLKLAAGHGDGQINRAHHQAAEHAGAHRVARHRTGFFHAPAPDHVYHHNAKGQAGKRVHGVIAFQKALKKRLAGITARRLNIVN